jgi:nitrogen regulatory protein PII
MKELLIIVRREKSCDVKNLLSGMGLAYVSKTVKGRGKEGGDRIQNEKRTAYVFTSQDADHHMGGG